MHREKDDMKLVGVKEENTEIDYTYGIWSMMQQALGLQPKR